jgi:hypothetical protein
VIAHKIVVSCRMPDTASYLERARSVTSRAEALGASLVAWSATTFAFAWDVESVEEAITFATSLTEDVSTPALSWASGIAEGDMELLAAKGRADLAWGDPLVSAVALARIAHPGEVLLDPGLRAVHVGELATHGMRTSSDMGKRVSGLRLNTSHPWRLPSSMRIPSVSVDHVAPKGRGAESVNDEGDATDDGPEMGMTPWEGVPAVMRSPTEADLTKTQAMRVPAIARGAAVSQPVETIAEEHSPIDVLELVEAQAAPSRAPPPLPAAARGRPARSALADRIRALAHASRAEGPDALLALKRTRARLEGASSAARCQSSLALAVALGLSGRVEESLLETLDALARAREETDGKAVEACLAYLAKLYAGARRPHESSELRDAKRPA